MQHPLRLVYVKTPKKTSRSARQRLADNLTRIRGDVGVSQEGLAGLAGLHRTFVGHVERNMRNPSLENVEKLAEALGVDIVELLADTSD